MDLSPRPTPELSFPMGGELVSVADSSQVSAARRAALALGQRAGLGADALGRLALVVTEAAGNLAKHAKEGVLIAQAVQGGVDVLAVDRGPGMANPARCLEDGFSTAGTPGTGMGAIRRAADLFDLDSQLGEGTVTFARVLEQAAAASPVEYGVVCLPITGERTPGDGWMVGLRDDTLLLSVIDGLGHGPDAAVAAETARAVLTTALARPGERLAPAALTQLAHGAMRHTRGAAFAVAAARAEGTLSFCGIGNIAAAVFGGEVGESGRSMVSHNGIVGHQMRAPQEFSYPATPGMTAVFASDGIRSQWRGTVTLARLARHPAVLAAVIWRAHLRGRDDATVLVARIPAARSLAPVSP